MTGRAPALSIVVPTYDRHELLPDLIRAVERQTLDADAFELIVVDNSSDRDARDAFLAGLSVDCRCDYVVEEQPGANRARNVGTGLARGGVVAFLDDDARPDPGWAAAVVARFAAAPSLGVMGGPVAPIWPEQRPVWLPAWADDILSILDHGPAARALTAREHLISANMAVRKAALEAVGGFPEHLGRHGRTLLSNDELGVRRAVEARGAPAFYDPAMRVRHRIHPDRLTQAWLRRRMAWQAVSDLIEAGGRTLDPAADLAALSAEGGLAWLLAEGRDADQVSARMRAVRGLVEALLGELRPAPRA